MPGQGDGSHFEQLLLAASSYRMTKKERAKQRISFAYGNLKIDNPNVTRELVEKAALTLEKNKK